MLEEAHSRGEQLEGVEEQLYVARKKSKLVKRHFLRLVFSPRESGKVA